MWEFLPVEREPKLTPGYSLFKYDRFMGKALAGSGACPVEALDALVVAGSLRPPKV